MLIVRDDTQTNHPVHLALNNSKRGNCADETRQIKRRYRMGHAHRLSTFRLYFVTWHPTSSNTAKPPAGITVTFNATSLLLGALAALAVGGVAAAIAIPLAVVFGLKKKYYDYDDYSGYSSSGGYGDSGNSGYNEGGSSYTAYAKR